MMVLVVGTSLPRFVAMSDLGCACARTMAAAARVESHVAEAHDGVFDVEFAHALIRSVTELMVKMNVHIAWSVDENDGCFDVFLLRMIGCSEATER